MGLKTTVALDLSNLCHDSMILRQRRDGRRRHVSARKVISVTCSPVPTRVWPWLLRYINAT